MYMRRLIESASIASVIALSACSPVDFEQQSAKEMQASMELNDERKEIAEDWLQAGVKIAEQTGNERALMLAEFVVENYVVGFAGERGVALMEEPDNNDVVILPLMEEDRGLNEYIDMILENPTNAEFHEDIRSILLKERVEMSDIGKGILFLHEADHAKRWEENYSSPTEEAEVYEFQFELQEALGGDEYKRLKQFLYEELLPNYESFPDGTFMIPFYPPTTEQLHEVYGNFKPGNEERLLASGIWLHAASEIIKEKHPEDYIQTLQNYIRAVESLTFDPSLSEDS